MRYFDFVMKTNAEQIKENTKINLREYAYENPIAAINKYMYKNMKFVVFLDVDGVLNTKTTVERTPEFYTGIDDARVEILAKAVRKYGDAEIVLSSDWKNLRADNEDLRYLNSKLKKQGLTLAGKTTDHWSNRGEGILKYLELHPEIDDFVILDDNKFDFMDYQKLWERLLITNGIERAEFASQTPAVETIIFSEYIKMFS